MYFSRFETLGNLFYCPQELTIPAESTVTDILGVSEKLQALNNIIAGSTLEKDFLCLNDDWDIRERVMQQLGSFELAHLDLTRSLQTLSGGEKTRLILAKAFLARPDFIILDEPTNNLDLATRRFLYGAIENWRGGMIVVSHDRIILNRMEKIVELTPLGATLYGGNYDYFLEQKALQRNAVEWVFLDAKKALEKTQASLQSAHEKHDKKKSQGRKLRRTGKIDKLTANSKKGRSERTKSRNAKLGETLLNKAENQVNIAKAKIEINEEINICLPLTEVHKGKTVVEMEDVTFAYTEEILIRDFNLTIRGPERIALCGKNGAGKSTLIKLILNQIKPSNGKITVHVKNISYLDQNASLLNPEMSLLENFCQYNPEMNESEGYFYLAQFLFRNIAALKLVKNLSGGEKIRAQLACTLMSKTPPQLLILDEPTNHLDLESIASIESALKNYRGAMIVVSHDETFLTRLDIEKFIAASFV